MEAVESYMLIADVTSREASRVASSSADELVNKNTTLVEVIQSLRHFINDEDATVRSKAIHFLSHVLADLPTDFLSRQQLSVLVEFFTARIQDGGSLGALEHLQSLPRFTSEMAITIMRALAGKFNDLQTLPQSWRFEVYIVLHSLMKNHRAPLRSMEDESLSAIIDIVAAEKDPRNLMMVFSILRAVMVEWDISRFVEPLFEGVFCYFPITFRPPPNDPYGITAKDLKDRLKECIASSSYLAPYVFPQLIEKLDSPSMNAKRDVIEAIKACADSYESNVLAKYAVSLWDALKFEIIAEQDKEIATETLDTLRSITKSLGGRDSYRDEKNLLNFLGPVIKELREHLEEPQQKQAQGASRILNAIGCSSQASFSLLVEGIVPAIIDQYWKAPNASYRKGTFVALRQLLDAGASIETSDNYHGNGPGIPLLPYKGQLFSIMSQAILGTHETDISIQLLALRCLQRSCSYQPFLSDVEVVFAVRHFNDLLLLPRVDHRKELSDVAAEAIKELSESRERIIFDISIPFLEEKLNAQQGGSDDKYLIALDALARIGGSRNIFDAVLRCLFTHFDVIVGLDDKVRDTKATLITLCIILKNGQTLPIPSILDYLSKVTELIRRVAYAACGERSTTLLNRTENTVLLGIVASLIVKKIDTLHQFEVGKQIYKLYFRSPVFVGIENARQQNDARRQTIFLSTALLAAINKDVKIPYPPEQLPELADNLIDLAIQEPAGPIRHGLHQHICLLINKFMTEETFRKVHLVRWLVRDDRNTELVISEQSIHTIFWVAKALIHRLSNVSAIVESLTELIESPVVGRSASQGFAMLLASDSVICRENGATMRLLGRQKVLSQTLPRLFETYHRGSHEIRINCLIAFSGLLIIEESDVTVIDMDQIIPMLMQSFELDDLAVQLSTLKNLLLVLNQNPQGLEQHIDGLLSRFERILSNTSPANTELRLTAIECLWKFPSAFASDKVIANQSDIMRLIEKALDDPRRSIRKKAVECQHQWLQFGQESLES